MAKWNIQVTKDNHGFTWAAFADDGEFLNNDLWSRGVFITEESAIHDAISVINAAAVKKTGKRINPNLAYYDYEVNYG